MIWGWISLCGPRLLGCFVGLLGAVVVFVLARVVLLVLAWFMLAKWRRSWLGGGVDGCRWGTIVVRCRAGVPLGAGR